MRFPASHALSCAPSAGAGTNIFSRRSGTCMRAIPSTPMSRRQPERGACPRSGRREMRASRASSQYPSISIIVMEASVGVKDGGAPPFCSAKSLPPPPLRGRVPRSLTPALTVHGFEGSARRHPFANQGHRAPDSQSLFSLSRIPRVARDRVGLKDDGAPPFFWAGRASRLACDDGDRPKKS